MGNNISHPVVVDIETKNTFRDVGAYEPTLLNVSVVGLYDYRTDSYESFFEEEIDKLWSRLERARVIIGFNSEHFDLPILNKYYPGNLLQLPSLDLLTIIRNKLGKGVRLDDVAMGTLGYGKTGDGLKAISLWNEQKLEELKSYCLSDVKLTKELYEHGKQHGFFKYTTPLGIKQIAVNCDLPSDSSTINLTLPI